VPFAFLKALAPKLPHLYGHGSAPNDIELVAHLAFAHNTAVGFVEFLEYDGVIELGASIDSWADLLPFAGDLRL